MAFIFLREDSQLDKKTQSITTVDNPPQALVDLSKIINNDLCHRCGSCIGVCPTKVLGTDYQDFPIIEDLSACINCNLCVKVCPGADFDAPKYTEKLFGREVNVRDIHGYFEKVYLGYSMDPAERENATSGGVGTAVLSHLLSNGSIDGAVICRARDDEKWRGEPFIARTKEELIANAKPKYVFSPTNSILNVIANNPGRYAIVGTPCQVHGIRKASRYLKKLDNRIVLTIGIFCHATLAHETMRRMWQMLGGNDPQVARYISRYGKHPGTPYLEYKNKSKRPFFFPNKTEYRPNSTEILNFLYLLDTQPRCFTCYDHTSEFADISLGDPWMLPPENITFNDGYSFVLARTKRGLEALQNCEQQDKIKLHELDVTAAKTCNITPGSNKRWRAFYLINKNKNKQKPVPSYHFELPRLSLKWSIKSRIDIFLHSASFRKGSKKHFLLFIFSPLGYSLLWLNNQRRRLRGVWLLAKRKKSLNKGV